MVSRPSNAIGSIEARHPSLPATSADAPTTTLTVAPASFSEESAVVDVIAEAFLNDPTWSWAFPDPAARRRWWEFCMDGALRYPWTLRPTASRPCRSGSRTLGRSFPTRQNSTSLVC